MAPITSPHLSHKVLHRCQQLLRRPHFKAAKCAVCTAFPPRSAPRTHTTKHLQAAYTWVCSTSSRTSTHQALALKARGRRSEEHTSELQSLMRISYAVFCLKKNTKHTLKTPYTI